MRSILKKNSLIAISFQKYYRKFSNKAISSYEILKCNDKDTRKQQKTTQKYRNENDTQKKISIFNYKNCNNNNKYKI